MRQEFNQTNHTHISNHSFVLALIIILLFLIRSISFLDFTIVFISHSVLIFILTFLNIIALYFLFSICNLIRFNLSARRTRIIIIISLIITLLILDIINFIIVPITEIISVLTILIAYAFFCYVWNQFRHFIGFITTSFGFAFIFLLMASMIFVIIITWTQSLSGVKFLGLFYGSIIFCLLLALFIEQLYTYICNFLGHSCRSCDLSKILRDWIRILLIGKIVEWISSLFFPAISSFLGSLGNSYFVTANILNYILSYHIITGSPLLGSYNLNNIRFLKILHIILFF